MIIALVLNVFGHITRPWCNMLLGLLNLLLTMILGDSTVEIGENTQSGGGESVHLPSDICTVRKKFDLNPSTHTYAMCPLCCCTYSMIEKGKQSAYPEHCTFKKYWGSKPCGQLLIRTTKHGSTKLTSPIKPFVVQDYSNFLAGLLSRPSMEEAMEHGTLLNYEHQLWDIKDGTAITGIQDPDSKAFMDGLKRSDLCLAWSLSIDWFNPMGNKIGGKKKSVGSIVMTILNLPLSLWYKPENIYLVGVIPGLREPSLDEINHILCLLIDIFLAAWKVGTWITETTAHTMGCLIRSVALQPQHCSICVISVGCKSQISETLTLTIGSVILAKSTRMQPLGGEMLKQRENTIRFSKKRGSTGLSFFVCHTGIPLIYLLLMGCTTFSWGWHSFNLGTSLSSTNQEIKAYADPKDQYPSLLILQN